MRTVFIAVPTTTRVVPQAVIDALNALSTIGGTIVQANFLFSRHGSVTIPAGAVSAEIINDDGYFYPNRATDHTVESVEGWDRPRIVDLAGDLTINVYSFDAPVVLVRVIYA